VLLPCAHTRHITIFTRRIFLRNYRVVWKVGGSYVASTASLLVKLGVMLLVRNAGFGVALDDN